MATVTKQFRDDFETFTQHRIDSGEFTPEQVLCESCQKKAKAGDCCLKAMIRADITPGPDILRSGLDVINAAGVTVPAMIDDHEERYRLWAGFFAAWAIDIAIEHNLSESSKSSLPGAVGINQRIRQSNAMERKEAA